MNQRNRTDVSQVFADEPCRPELESLFAKARRSPPQDAQLIHMLRAVRRGRDSRPIRMVRRAVPWMAAAAAIAAVVLIVVGIDQPPAFALSQVAESLRQVAVVKQTSPNGAVSWESPGRYVAHTKPDGSSVAFWNFESQTHATFDASRGCIMLATCEPLSKGLRWTGGLSLDELVETAESWGSSFDEKWERGEVEIEGKVFVELRAKTAGSGASRILIDPETRLVVRSGSPGRWTEYEYPSEGPRDLYDLGVPRDTPVVDGTASAELLELRRKVLAARGDGFGSYRMVSVSTVGGSGMHRVITDGHRYRVENYFAAEASNWTLEELRSRAVEQIDFEPLSARPAAFTIFDGQTETQVHFDKTGKLIIRSVRPAPFASFQTHTLKVRTWRHGDGFFHPWADRQDEYVGPDDRGWVAMRVLGQANLIVRPWLYETWYDPARGYRVVKQANTQFAQAPWQLDASWNVRYDASPQAVLRGSSDSPDERSEWEVLEWAELRPGQWYPALSRSRQLKRSEDGEWREGGERAATYTFVVAQPLDRVDESWFEIPDAGLAEIGGGD